MPSTRWWPKPKWRCCKTCCFTTMPLTNWQVRVRVFIGRLKKTASQCDWAVMCPLIQLPQSPRQPQVRPSLPHQRPQCRGAPRPRPWPPLRQQRELRHLSFGPATAGRDTEPQRDEVEPRNTSPGFDGRVLDSTEMDMDCECSLNLMNIVMSHK